MFHSIWHFIEGLEYCTPRILFWYTPWLKDYSSRIHLAFDLLAYIVWDISNLFATFHLILFEHSLTGYGCSCLSILILRKKYGCLLTWNWWFCALEESIIFIGSFFNNIKLVEFILKKANFCKNYHNM